MTGRQLHRSTTMVMSLLITLIGVALVVEAVGGHGSAFSPRLLMGVLFILAGLGRLYIEVRRGRGTRT